jgi:4-amino-4-deoxy-L-arabinose transferase-like glycosyltransferase
MSTRLNPATQLRLLLTLVLLLRIAAALLILHIDGPIGFLNPDTSTYIAPADSLLHGSFSSNGVPDVVRTPGYPLLLVPAIASHHPVLVAVAENLLLATISAWLIWIIAAEVAPLSNARAWAVLLYCFEPVGFLYSEKMLSDQLFATLFLIFLWLAIRFLNSPTYSWLLGSAIALGLATYSRPVSLYLGVLLAALFLFVPRRLAWPQRIRRAIAFALVFVATLVPWMARNNRVAGYRGFSAIVDINLYFYSGAAVEAKLEHKNFLQVQDELGWSNEARYFQAHPEQRTWSQGQIFAFEHAEARTLILDHPLTYALIHLRGCTVVLLDPAVTEVMKLLRRYPENGGLLSRGVDQGTVGAILWLIRHYPETALALPIFGLQLLFYYFVGLAGLRRLPTDVAALLISLCAYFIFVSGSSPAVARFRVPIMPLVCISGAAAISQMQRRKTSTASPTFEAASS